MNSTQDSAQPRCHDCGMADLRLAEGFSDIYRVTSDCKPWPPGGLLARCPDCGLVQTVVNSRWESEIQKIYDAYTIYYQSGGVEQPVFTGDTGAGRSRSEAIVRQILNHVPMPERGRLLDIGCGNGAFLRACSGALPKWSLCGSEVNDKYRSIVESIPGVEKLYIGPWEAIPGTFDAISLIHVIEHIPAPSAFLRSLRSKLNPGGLVILEVPDCSQNYFMLPVADHCSHFSPAMLGAVAAKAGLRVMHATNSWVPKEVTVLACYQPNTPAPATPHELQRESEQVLGGWFQLRKIVGEVEALAGEGALGIFGTSIAATWLDAQSGRKAGFFVDEDPNRVGKQHAGRPIFSVAQIPEQAFVYVALPPPLAGRVAERLRRAKPGVRFITP